MGSRPGWIAVSGPDQGIRTRIVATLRSAGYAVTEWPEPLEQPLQMSGPLAFILASPQEKPGGQERIAALRERLPGVPLIIVGTGSWDGAAWGLMRAGVDGLVREHELEHTLVASVNAVLADQLCLPRTMRPALAQPVFSHREKQVLSLATAGLTNGEIASRLYLSESTVKSHLSSSFRKLGVSSRSEAARRARPRQPVSVGL